MKKTTTKRQTLKFWVEVSPRVGEALTKLAIKDGNRKRKPYVENILIKHVALNS